MKTQVLTEPVFTEKAECQDCFKCVRNCPVKAIKITQGSAVVIPEMCVACGRCVRICPARAKRVRRDTGRARRLIEMGRKVYVSLAPSFITEFSGVHPEQLVTAFHRMGFAGVSETALGAEHVSAATRNALEHDRTPRILLSSACPAAVDMLQKYRPGLARFIMPVVSPLLAHCRLIKQWRGQDAHVVFVGPCVAKKKEADANPDLLDAAMTFQNFREWMADASLLEQLGSLPLTPFFPHRAEGGALYPVDGGMIAGICRGNHEIDSEYMSLSGMEQMLAGLEGMENTQLERPLFIELLACDEGCVNGPGTEETGRSILKRLGVINSVKSKKIPEPECGIEERLPIDNKAIVLEQPSENAVQEALRKVGKTCYSDELNCGGCGYESCRDFAVALIHMKAEPTMCVSYMRRLAQNKATALMHAMPSGVVIVDENLRVVECNRAFAELLGPESCMAYDAKPGLQGVELANLLPDIPLFENVLRTGESLVDRNIRIASRVCLLTIFTIEPQRLIGAVLADITQPAAHRGQIIRKAQEVIRKNLTTVQQIACLLGENAAESEMILNSIITSFSNSHGMENTDNEYE